MADPPTSATCCVSPTATTVRKPCVCSSCSQNAEPQGVPNLFPHGELTGGFTPNFGLDYLIDVHPDMLQRGLSVNIPELVRVGDGLQGW